VPQAVHWAALPAFHWPHFGQNICLHSFLQFISLLETIVPLFPSVAAGPDENAPDEYNSILRKGIEGTRIEG